MREIGWRGAEEGHALRRRSGGASMGQREAKTLIRKRSGEPAVKPTLPTTRTGNQGKV
jgi:hypothetical protein